MSTLLMKNNASIYSQSQPEFEINRLYTKKDIKKEVDGDVQAVEDFLSSMNISNFEFPFLGIFENKLKADNHYNSDNNSNKNNNNDSNNNGNNNDYNIDHDNKNNNSDNNNFNNFFNSTTDASMSGSFHSIGCSSIDSYNSLNNINLHIPFNVDNTDSDRDLLNILNFYNPNIADLDTSNENLKIQEVGSQHDSCKTRRASNLSTVASGQNVDPDLQNIIGFPLTRKSKCHNCQTHDLRLKRHDIFGNPLCNACGLYYRKYGTHRTQTMISRSETRKQKK
eukprot:Awhi_evm1s9827